MASWLGTVVEDLRFEVGPQAGVALDREDLLVDFVLTPVYAERVLSFGTLLCLDAFLQTITIVPLRALRQLAARSRGTGGDIYRFGIMAAVYRVLQSVNTSRVYHGIRGQAGITMFVMYSLMAVFDKFMCAMGHDISECLVSPRTARSRRRAALYSCAAFAYTLAHSFILMWQLVTVNLAVNSYSNALLSFMLTQQIGEIKTAVFKRADKHALFQITCADITQRFQLGATLLVIVLRNILEHWWSNTLTLAALGSVCGPPALLMAADVLVDWLKCAYMTSFNSIRPRPLYTEFYESLREDYAANYHRGAQHLLSKQAGLPVAPLAVVCVRMFAKGGVLYHPITPVLFVLLLFTKLRLGRWLRGTTAARVRAHLSTAPSETVPATVPATVVQTMQAAQAVQSGSEVENTSAVSRSTTMSEQMQIQDPYVSPGPETIAQSTATPSAGVSQLSPPFAS